VREEITFALGFAALLDLVGFDLGREDFGI
jgi:hypothetical protein